MGHSINQQAGRKPGRKRHILALALAAALFIGVCGCQKTPNDNTDNQTTQQGATDSSNMAGGTTNDGNEVNQANPNTQDGQPSNATEPNQADASNSANPANSSDASNPPADSSPSADGATEGNPVVIYVPDEQAEILTPVGTTATDDSDQALVDALIQAGALPEGVEVLSATEKDGILTLDMNKAFSDAVRSSGSAGEAMLIYSLVNTFIQARDVAKVMITVDEGGLLESGHEVYDYPLEMSYLK